MNGKPIWFLRSQLAENLLAPFARGRMGEFWMSQQDDDLSIAIALASAITPTTF
jgi:hypothetical protein